MKNLFLFIVTLQKAATYSWGPEANRQRQKVKVSAFFLITVFAFADMKNKTFSPNFVTDDTHTAAICHLGGDGGWVVQEAFAVSSQVPWRGSSSRWPAQQIQKTENKTAVHMCMHVSSTLRACFPRPQNTYWSFASARVCINLQHVRLIDLRRKRRPSVTHCSSSTSIQRVAATWSTVC